MCVIRAVLCIFVSTVLFGCISHSRCKCNYSEILGAYKALILAELQNLNLTGLFPISKEKDRCPSGKVQHILRSIYAMTQLFKCHTKERWKPEVGKTVERMEQLISGNCKEADMVKMAKHVTCKTRRGPNGRKKGRKNIVKALTLCWQKLQTIYVPTAKRRP